uniref:Uncharacterized protein n=1 Tax=Anguilla anguilla TaxID=7936 RepID=A0A0E9QE54_ANGAN
MAVVHQHSHRLTIIHFLSQTVIPLNPFPFV